MYYKDNNYHLRPEKKSPIVFNKLNFSKSEDSYANFTAGPDAVTMSMPPLGPRTS